MAIAKKWKTLVLGAVGLSLCGTSSLAGDVWKIQSHLPTGHVVYKNEAQWVEDVNVMLGGRLTLELLPGGSVVPPNETIDAIKMGIIDGDITSPVYFAGRDAAFAMLADLVGGYEDWVQALSWCEMGGGKELFQELYEPYGIHFAGCPNAGIESVVSKVPIRNIEEFKGVKIRAPQGLASDIFKEMGAVPVNMSASDVFTALEKGVVDAADNSSYVMNSEGGFHDIAKYPILDFHSLPVLSITFNKRKFDKQPEDIQAILTMAARDLATQINMQDLVNRGASMQKDSANGVEVIKWSKEEKEKMRAIAREVWAKASKASPAAKKAYDSHVAHIKRLGLLTDE